MDSYISGGSQPKDNRKQDPDGPTCLRMGSEKGLTIRNFIVCTVHLIQ